ncbi:SDR family oxidoreductase [Nocardia sp. NRRL S-836]|uniref:SDR family oxidoreductase n=1 Tax=Nocardia sp. NRRL S-836 TaxID=1519492 RepID=UPI0006AE6493|nr:SDR family oxidoreductase [Nocardia sp. NRRL S-836]
MRCLVTGATGYLGGRLVPRLLAEGHQVRCLVRSPEKLRDVPWAADVEIVRGDVLGDLSATMRDVDVVHYLVHSLNSKDFADADRRAAENTAAAAARAGVQRIVYLGGLHPEHVELSPHLASRKEVGEVFLRSPVPAVVLQAAVIIGSGSASFEMLRYLTERLPVMVTPRWVHNRIQPIAVRDVLRYLVDATALDTGLQVNRTFDIGGPDVLTYLDMMLRYARVAGLPRRRVLPVPLLTPGLSSHWVNVVTPVPRSIATPLIESLVHEVVCRENDVRALLPGENIGYDQAVELALAKIRDADVETRWSGASVPGAPSEPLPTDPDWSGGSVYVDERGRATKAGPERLWEVVEGIGGERGWYSFPLAWAIRGWLDRLAGGVGLRRGRRDPHRLHVGDALDWWRVEEIERGRLLRLRAEMKVPGQAWLELRVADGPRGGSTYRQRAVFVPKGLAGHLYWAVIWPFHGIVFGGMVRNIANEAELHNNFRKS